MRDRVRVSPRLVLAASSCCSKPQALLWPPNDARNKGTPTELTHRAAPEEYAVHVLIRRVRTSGLKTSLELWLRNESKPGPKQEDAWRYLQPGHGGICKAEPNSDCKDLSSKIISV